MPDTLKKLREPAAMAALAFAGLSLLAAVLDLLLPPSSNGYSAPFANRGFDEVTAFLGVEVAAAVAFAGYVANNAGPAVPRARLLTLVALIEAGVAALFGVICVLALFGAGQPGEVKFSRFLEGAGGGAVLAIAGWYVLLCWQAHAGARPQRAPAGWPNAPQQGGGPIYPQQQQPAPPPGGFGWTPQQQPTGSGQPPMPNPQAIHPQAFGGADQTQMLQPVPPVGAAPPRPQPPLPPAMQNYAPQPQPWSPGGQLNQPPQQQQPPQPEQRTDQPFTVGDWRSE
jgi:hypothetical protein